MKISIFGGTGFIGNQLSFYLEKKRIPFQMIPREAKLNKKIKLCHVIYCIGMTADFRNKPFETVEAHVCKLKEILQNSTFTSFLYLSSTRVYSTHRIARPNDKIHVNPTGKDYLYNISKLMGEALCFSTPNKKVRVVRISNVVGNDFKSSNFIYTILRQAIDQHKIVINSHPQSAKDYISINDVCPALINIALYGKKRIYNFGSGKNITHETIVKKIASHTHCEVIWNNLAEKIVFPVISIESYKSEFPFRPKNIISEIEKVITFYQTSKRHDPDKYIK